MFGDEIQLTEGNYLYYAQKAYDNPNLIEVKEFYDDLNKVKYIKRLFNRYYTLGTLKERLILNHVVEMYNVFGDFTTRMLFHKVDEEFYPILKTFLVYLNRMPDRVIGAKNQVLLSTNIPIVTEVASKLRKL